MSVIRKIYTAHTLNAVSLSIITIYVPAYMLTLGFSLSQVILFFAIFHSIGLVFALFVFPFLMKKVGLLHSFKLYFPLQIVYMFMLSTIKLSHVSPELIAVIGGVANFAYWLPMNIFLIKYSQEKDLGVNLSRFFALPSLFGILGPILGTLLIPTLGFWPVFFLTIIGLVSSFIPLSRINTEHIKVELNVTSALKKVAKNKTLFLFEFLDNIIEESEWFWSIYVFIVIGSLAMPGIVGSLEAVGGSIFTFIIGKYTDKYGRKIIPFAALLLTCITFLRLFVITPISAYVLTVTAGFALTVFLVTYFSTVYKRVKNDGDVEFMILREVPTVLGRLIVFGGIYLTLGHLRYFFILPVMVIIVLFLLYVWKGKATFVSES